MISHELYKTALELRDMTRELDDETYAWSVTELNIAADIKALADEVISQYNEEALDRIQRRLSDGPVFSDDELVYAAHRLCLCGYGLAYPDGCGSHHYWSCSAVLKGTHDVSQRHSEKLFFAWHKIAAESKSSNTTREVKP